MRVSRTTLEFSNPQSTRSHSHIHADEAAAIHLILQRSTFSTKVLMVVVVVVEKLPQSQVKQRIMCSSRP